MHGVRQSFHTKGWRSVVPIFLCALILLLCVRAFFFTQVVVRQDRPDMDLVSGDRVLVCRTCFGFRLPLQSLWGYHRWGGRMPMKGEIVVFDYPEGVEGVEGVGMEWVTALPGDTLWLSDQPDTYIIVPDGALGLGDYIIPDSCVAGLPFCISYSVDSAQPFYKMMRPNRIFKSLKWRK